MKTWLLAIALTLMAGGSHAIGGMIDFSSVDPNGVTLGTYTVPGSNPVTISFAAYNQDPSYDAAYDTAILWPDAVTGSTLGDLVFRFALPVYSFRFDYTLTSWSGSLYDNDYNGKPLVSATISDGVDDVVNRISAVDFLDTSDPATWFASGSFRYDAPASAGFHTVSLQFFPIKTDISQQFDFTVTNVGSNVPEPASAMLLGLGLVGVGWYGSRRRTRKRDRRADSRKD